MITLYQVILLREFRTEGPRPIDVYPEGSWQHAWQDRHGFWWLRGAKTGWEFSTNAQPDVDFAFPYGERPIVTRLSHGQENATKKAWSAPYWRPGHHIYDYWAQRAKQRV